tara:strand:+ start:29 stop:484 length:456 start_codon:yes stop_codon:yes gene_type:complete
MVKKFIILILSTLFLYSCEYKPIYSEKNIKNFYIKKIDFRGNNNVNILLKNNLKRYSKLKNGKKYIINSSSKYTKTSQSKNKSGNTTYYLLNLQVSFEIISENKKNTLNFEEKFIMKNYSNEYDENNYEKSVQKNMANLIVENLILQLSRM